MSQDVVYVIIALIIAMVLHEAGHGAVAYALGDDTAKRAGRLTLNPLKHIDPIGSILLPGVLVLIGAPFLYGWAKPVPVNPFMLRWHGQPYPRQLMAVVAVAGPAVNFALAILGGFLLYTPLPPDFVQYFILINLVIGIFNLLPVPPMDGGRIAVGILPAKLAQAYARMERWGLALVFLVLVVLPMAISQTGGSFNPLAATVGRVLDPAFNLVLTLTGHNVSGN